MTIVSEGEVMSNISLRKFEPRESAKLTRYGNHVLNSMIAIGKVSQRTLLINDANGGLLSANSNVSDIVRSLALFGELVVKDERGFRRGLSV